MIGIDLLKMLLPHFPMLLHSLFSMTRAHFKKLWEELPWLACACLAAALGWQTHRLDNRNVIIASMKTQAAESTANWTQNVLKLDGERLALADQTEKNYLAGERHAKAQTDRLIADLRSGNIRLRQQLAANAAPVARSQGSNDSAARGHHAAASGGLHESDAEFLIRFAGNADSVTRQLGQCQDYIEGLQHEKAICAAPAHH